ncbi:unnamed protein product [Rangifer tarandus platyrhynchus]|uniref:Uncharacterized protein n=2 Tax=Rangifer tarandus platyrhynchus TaxID=3082113 RepID=A0ABN8ZU95_RANTA|nr:unnamed protein product [Rangifer tarandus platyrhynchus]CAI9709313.1 unnamed protein product [Rangifer tarandus platyrhynchus]
MHDGGKGNPPGPSEPPCDLLCDGAQDPPRPRVAPRDHSRTRPSPRGQCPCSPRRRVSAGPSLRGASGVHELRRCACVQRTLPSPESTPAAPFSRRPLPLEPQGRARLPAARPPHSVSAALTVEAGLRREETLQAVSSVPPGDQGRVRTLPGAGRPSEGLRALLSAPPFLPRKRRGRMRGPPQRPRALSPGCRAAFSSGCGFCCSGRGGASAPRVLGSSQQPPAGLGVRRRPEGTAASRSLAHTL